MKKILLGEARREIYPEPVEKITLRHRAANRNTSPKDPVQRVRVQLHGEQQEDAMTQSFARAVSQSIESKKERGVPVAKYDPDSDVAFLEYADGRREYVEAP